MYKGELEEKDWDFEPYSTELPHKFLDNPKYEAWQRVKPIWEKHDKLKLLSPSEHIDWDESPLWNGKSHIDYYECYRFEICGWVRLSWPEFSVNQYGHINVNVRNTGGLQMEVSSWKCVRQSTVDAIMPDYNIKRSISGRRIVNRDAKPLKG